MSFLIFRPGSFAVQYGDHFRSEIICGSIWGSFAVRDHLRSWDHLRTRKPYLAERQFPIVARIHGNHLTANQFSFFQL